MGQNVGSFGSISFQGNTITIEIESDTLGSLALTAPDSRVECYWDGNQWVCNAIGFSQSQTANQGQNANTC